MKNRDKGFKATTLTSFAELARLTDGRSIVRHQGNRAREDSAASTTSSREHASRALCRWARAGFSSKLGEDVYKAFLHLALSGASYLAARGDGPAIEKLTNSVQSEMRPSMSDSELLGALLILACVAGSSDGDKTKLQSNAALVVSRLHPDDRLSNIDAALCPSEEQRRLLMSFVRQGDVTAELKRKQAGAVKAEAGVPASLGIEQLTPKRRIRPEAIALRARLKTAIQDAEHRVVAYHNVEGFLDEDLELVSMWDQKLLPVDRSAGRFDRLLSLDMSRSNVSRLVTARQGEKAALAYLKMLSQSVVDLSVQQVRRGGSNDWQYADIEADGTYYDVKTARASFNKPDAYSEFYVKQVKQAPSDGKDVNYLAVYSEYQTFERIKENHGAMRFTVLGVTTRTSAGRVASWLSPGMEIKADALLGDNRKIPGWMFEYPEPHYRDRKQVISQVEQVVQDAVALEGFNLDLVPSWMLVFQRNQQVVAKVVPSPRRSQRCSAADLLYVWKEISTTRDEVGISRATLFLSALKAITRGARAPILQNVPDALVELLFGPIADEESKKKPLMLYDPLKYVWEVIDAMRVAWAESRTMLGSIERFSIQSPGIVLGRTQDGRTVTVIAYCGGDVEYQEGRKIRCGNSPLVIGREETCPRCSKLVCKKCGYCSATCVGLRRQSTTAV